MKNINNLNPFYTGFRGSTNSKIEKLSKEQLNPKYAYNSNRLKQELIIKNRKSVGVDSSYYLG